MGCSSSHTTNETKVTKTPALSAINQRKVKFHKDAEYFTRIHTAFKEEMMNRIFMEDLDEVERDKTTNINTSLNHLWDKHSSEARKARLDKTQFNQLVMELIGENMIKTKFSHEEYDMFKVIKEKLTEIFSGLSNENKAGVMNILQSKEGYYLRKQNGIIYYTDKIQSEINPYWKALNNNLKFNTDLVIHCLTLVLTPNLFSKDGVFEDLNDIIEFNPNLVTVNIVVLPVDLDGNYYESYNLNPKTYKYLFRIFESVKNNPNIKVLLFNCAKNYEITLPPEISQLIHDKIKEDTLLGFHIGNFYLSDYYTKAIMDELTLAKNMTYLGMDMEITNPTVLDHLKQSLLKNKSLSAIILSGFFHESNSNFFEEMRTEISQNKNVKFFHYEKNIEPIKLK